MTMGSWFDDASSGAFEQDNALLGPESDAERLKREQGPVYGPPAPTAPPVGINPNQGGFRQTEMQPTPTQWGGPVTAVANFATDTLLPAFMNTQIGGQPIGFSQGPAAFSPPTYQQGTQAEIPYTAQANEHLGGVGQALGDPVGLGGVGRFVLGNALPENIGDAALMSGMAGTAAGPIEALTGLPVDDWARTGVRTLMPEPSMFPGLGAGIPPFDPMRDLPKPPDLGQGPQMLGGELPAPGGRLYEPGTEPFRGVPEPLPAQGLPGGIVDRNAFQIAQTWAENTPNVPHANLADNEVKTALYNAGLDSSGSPAAARARYEMADAAGVKLPLDQPPSEMPDAFDLARRGMTPQSPLNAPPASYTGDIAHNEMQALDNARALEGGGSTPIPPSAETAAAGSPLPSSQIEAVQENIGRPLDPEETAAVTRRLETPANSPEGIAERAGIGQAPTRAQALEDAQQTFTERVQAQAERFRAGNGRDMTPTEYTRMAETERVGSGIQPEQVRAGILDWLNLPRSLMTGMDLSFALRQMAVLAPSHPIEWAKSVGTGVRSALSEDYALQVAQRIDNSPFKGVHENLYIAPAEKGVGSIAQREEQYATSLLDRIPILGEIYRPFERGNVAMLNQFRSDVADNFAKNTLALKGETLGALSPATQRQIDVYDNFINRATGRGTLGQLDKSAVPLGQVFFSLRNTIAKPQVVASLASKPFTPAWNQMVKDTAGFFALGATTLYLANSAGLKVGVDPRSADFGKIKVGDTHVDIWGGWQQQARAVFQAVQGARGESNFVNGSGKESTKSPLQIALPWVGNRTSPQAGLAGQALRALAENKTDGGPVLDGLRQMFPDYRAPGLNAATAFNYLTPLSIQDTADAIKSEGIKGGLMAGPLSFFGVGVQTYPDTSNPRTAAVNNVMSKTDNLSALPPNVAAFLQDKSWNAATPKEQQAILARLSPEEKTAIEKGEQTLRDKHDIFQLNRDEARARAELAGQQREALKPTADKLLADWKSGAMPPEKAVEAIKRVEAAADKAANFTGNLGPKLSESSAYQDKVKDLPNDKTGDQKEVDRIREIQGKYYGIYDDPRVTRPDGTKDWDKIEAAQKAIMDTLRKSDPGFATRVEFNLAKNPDSDYELTKWITKIDDRLDKAGYYAVPTGGKTQFAREHPEVDALVSLKYGNPVHSERAGAILLSLAPERKVEYAK